MAKAAKRPAKKTAKSKAKKPGRNVGGLVKFKKGERVVGRQKGTKNKLGVKLKEAILEAAEQSGRDGKGKDGAVGYLVWLSRTEPAVFGRMLEKVMPLQIDVKDKTDHKMTPQEAIERLNERGIPVPPSLTTLAANVGRAVAERQDEDYDAELDGEADDEDGDEEEEIENAA